MVVQEIKRELKFLYFQDFQDEVILCEMLRLLDEHSSVVATDAALTEAKAIIQSWQQGDRETWACLHEVMKRLI